MFEEIRINLDLPPAERWNFLQSDPQEADVLIGYYLKDLGDVSFFRDAIEYYKSTFVKQEYLEEIRTIAAFSQYSENDILITNLYYDALKFVFGCTAFTVQTDGQKFHARNLDWWTENDALKKQTKVFHFTRNNQILYSAVSWIGFVGILSGMKPGKFSITLNAVSSTEKPNLAPPITFLIRDVLEKAASFEEALHMLSTTEIASDCLLMLAGVNPNEQVVIERTPRKFALRYSDENFLVVTNDYRQFSNDIKMGDVIQETSCRRFDRATSLLASRLPANAQECLAILSDTHVKMGITVQQMVFDLTNSTITVQ